MLCLPSKAFCWQASVRWCKLANYFRVERSRENNKAEMWGGNRGSFSKAAPLTPKTLKVVCFQRNAHRRQPFTIPRCPAKVRGVWGSAATLIQSARSQRSVDKVLLISTDLPHAAPHACKAWKRRALLLSIDSRLHDVLAAAPLIIIKEANSHTPWKI